MLTVTNTYCLFQVLALASQVLLAWGLFESILA